MINMYVAQNKDIAYRVIDEEAIILTPEDGMLHNLNALATRIFELANGARTVNDIVKAVCDEFDVDENTARRDTINFIEDLLHKKMLVLSNNPVKTSKR